MNALQIAATGMAAQQMRVDVISNNLANMSTTGYNARRAAGLSGFWLSSPLSRVAKVRRMALRMLWYAPIGLPITEGPVWDGEYLYFTHIHANTL